MGEEEIKRMILEGVVKDDGRIYLNFKYFQDDRRMSDLEVVSLLTASLSMSIKLAITDMDYETQGRFLKDVMGKIESDFFDVDAYKDLKKL